MPKAKIIRITEYTNKDIIEVCDAIKARAIEGTCFGLIYAIDEGRDEDDDHELHGVGAAGSYRRNPVQGRAIAGALFDYFGRLSRSFRKPGKL